MTLPCTVQSHQQASHLFARLCQHYDTTRPTIGDVIRFAGPQAQALLLLVFALPEALPLPVAGMSTILAIPLMLISLQMLLHGADMRLPVSLSQRKVPVGLLQAASARLAQLLGKLERVSRPRWQNLASQTRLIGAICLVLSLIIALPIPFGNMLPALCIVGIAIGMLQRDGVLVALSSVAGGIVTVGLSAAVIFAGSALVSMVGGT